MTSRLRNVVGPSAMAIIRAAFSWVSGSSEFSIADSYESKKMNITYRPGSSRSAVIIARRAVRLPSVARSQSPVIAPIASMLSVRNSMICTKVTAVPPKTRRCVAEA